MCAFESCSGIRSLGQNHNVSLSLKYCCRCLEQLCTPSKWDQVMLALGLCWLVLLNTEAQRDYVIAPIMFLENANPTCACFWQEYVSGVNKVRLGDDAYSCSQKCFCLINEPQQMFKEKSSRSFRMNAHWFTFPSLALSSKVIVLSTCGLIMILVAVLEERCFKG